MSRQPLPPGKLTIRHRQMRNVFQAFAGRQYLTGASGEDDDEAMRELVQQYDVTPGTPVTIHGYKTPTTIPAPRHDDI